MCVSQLGPGYYYVLGLWGLLLLLFYRGDGYEGVGVAALRD